MNYLGGRIQINPRPVQKAANLFEVAALGHCPGAANVAALSDMVEAVEKIKRLGFGTRLELKISDGLDLFHLPVPIRSAEEFHLLFPEAKTSSSEYRSNLAGDNAWLPFVVDDYFTNGGDVLWIIQVPEDNSVDDFLPKFDAPLYDVDNLYGLGVALVLNQVGLVLMPDLERLQIPTNLPDIPEKRLDNPAPQFIPCSQRSDEPDGERRSSSELPNNVDTADFLEVIQRLLGYSNKHRPDLQFLLSVPLDYEETSQSPSINAETLERLDAVRQRSDGYLLRQIQFVFPYVKSEQVALRTSAGGLAGLIASSVSTRGPWRSVANKKIIYEGKLYPKVSTQQSIQYRNTPGIGVLKSFRNQITLDDERLCVPALHRNDYNHLLIQSFDELRSGEVTRFMSYLVRTLKALGESLIFAADYRDPRPQLLLEKYFRNLYQLGALRGQTIEDAFSITRASSQEATIAFDIQIAPAFPIDKIELTLLNRRGLWVAEVANG